MSCVWVGKLLPALTGEEGSEHWQNTKIPAGRSFRTDHTRHSLQASYLTRSPNIALAL